MITRSARSGIVGSLLEKAGLKTSENVTKDLRSHRVTNDNDELEQSDRWSEEYNEPIHATSDDPDVNLYCLSTGKQVSNGVRDDLLACIETGEAWCKEFTDGCFEDGTRFEKPIRGRKVKIFTSDAVESRVTCKDQKLLELQGTRDLFGRLLYIGTGANVDTFKVFCYPLVPVPLSLGHVDGAMNKTDKSKLMHTLLKVPRLITSILHLLTPCFCFTY